MRSYLNYLANKVVDKVCDCSENGADIGEVVVDACESIKNQIDMVKNHRKEFFTELWNVADGIDLTEKECEYLGAVEGSIVMMCGGKL